jgi:ATP-dependent Clp protease ATP-binding subunit ClpA
MRKNFWQYHLFCLHNFGEAIINIFIFLPYFFSISTLLKTLFQPWRNLIVKKTTIGFSLNDWANRLFFNLISRTIGAFMRSSIIIFYFIFQTLFIILLPFIILIFFLFLPFSYLLSLFQKTFQEKKNIFKKKFIESHLLNKENLSFVENWFEKYYQQHLEKISWWKLSNLFSYPPLARDWAVGYTPILDQYTTDLATSIYLHHIKNMVDREKEIEKIEQILTKSIENNVMIVGEEGVGKHTIIDALAKKIYLGKTNAFLMYRRILKLNMEKILNEYVDQKQRENFFEKLLKEAEQAKNIILFIDNIDKYITTNQERIDLTVSIEKYSKNNFIQIIGITTPFAYQSFIFPNEKINRIFNKVDVYEVTYQEAENILLDSVFAFENHYEVSIFYETVKEVIEKSEFYLTYIPFPEKAVDLLDTACVYAKQNHSNIITPEIINIVLSEKTHIPTTLTKQIKEKLLNLETLLFSRIIQQDEAIKKLSSALRGSFLLVGKRKKPLATFLFLGPTGVGKTETAKTVADVFFAGVQMPNLGVSTNKYLLRFDMSEFQSKYDIQKLIGDDLRPGLLTQTIREQNYGVLLLDEIEKADKDLINIFLTIIDEGYFVDGQGKRVDCKNLIIIATSNAGSDFLYSQINPINSINFIDQLIKQNIFSPEFLNRFDGVIAFQSLNQQSIKILTKKIISQISIDVFKLHKIKVVVSEETFETLSQKGYDPRFGARNLERVIRDEIEDKIAKLILEDKMKPGEIINL